MRKERKEALLRRFPDVPYDIMNYMRHGRNSANFIVFLTNGNELFARGYHRYSDGKLIERQRYVFAKDGAVRYGKDDGKPWTIRSEFREPVFCQSCYGYNFDNSYRILNREAVQASCMKYSQLKHYRGDLDMEYLKLYCKHPNLEYLMKAGYGCLIGERYTGYWGGIRHLCADEHINWKSNNLLKMLGLTRTEFRALQGNERHYPLYMMWKERYRQAKPEELLTVARQFGYEYGTAENFCKSTGLKLLRIARYLDSQDISNRNYGDYLGQCRMMRYDLHDTAISMPHDFQTAHARLSAMIRYQQSEGARQRFAELYDSRKALEYASGGLLIRQPESMDEIIAEGRALNHCVGGYAERHAYGKLHIMFIRAADEPDEPYYTVEINLSGEIKQVHGLRNCNPTAEVSAFVKAYKQYLAAMFGREKRRKTA